MENATKALLIAAGLFFAVMILSLLVIFYNRVSDFYIREHEFAVTEQNQKFNAKFENYNRNDIRGSDLISLMNKVIDYNATQSYFEDKGYKRIVVNIHVGTENLDEFKYEFNNSKYGETNPLIRADITNATGSGDNYTNDKQLVAITGTSSDLITKAKANGFNITDTQLQQLQSKISNLIIDENTTDVRSIENRYYRANILENLIGWKISNMNLDKNTWKSNDDTVTKMEAIKDIASKYYQYTQFKRAYFDCKEIIYDTETKRVVRMEFEIQTKDGNVVFN